VPARGVEDHRPERDDENVTGIDGNVTQDSDGDQGRGEHARGVTAMAARSTR